MKDTNESSIEELAAEEEFENEIEKLKSELLAMKVSENELKDTIQKQHAIINVSAFTIDRFKHSQAHFNTPFSSLRKIIDHFKFPC